MSLAIVTYHEQYAPAFDQLNRVWLERYELFEESDRKYLEHPKETIIDHCGEIFFALQDGEVVGTCATLPHSESSVEIVKLAVADHAQGQGLARRLVESCIEWARQSGAQKVTLVSSTKLQAALALYEKLGFEYGELPPEPGYETADVYMEFNLTLSPVSPIADEKHDFRTT